MGEFYFLCVKNLSLERADSLECRASGHPVVCVSGPYQGGGQSPRGFVKNWPGPPGHPSRFVCSRKVWFGFFGLSVILPWHTSTGFLAKAPPSYIADQTERPTNDLPHPRPAWVSGGPLLTPCGAFGFNVGRLGDLPRGP